MTPESRIRLKQLLVSHESYRQFPYTDTTGHITIGIGRNISNRGISTTEAFYLLDDDIIYFSAKLDAVIPSFSFLDENRKIALIDMCFNLGVNGILEFHEFLEAVDKKEWQAAHDALLDSKAAIQCSERYKQLAEIILTGEI